jgi:glyoxylase-like metal-dependent hydrolase (beta-lactamase superfamily II)
VSAAPSPRSLDVAGWTVSLIELDALHAPLVWVDPNAQEGELGWLPCHVLLCRRGADVLLVDCGLGVFHNVFDMPVRIVPLAEGLAAAGCALGDVTTVVLTHLDPDHVGGIVTGAYPDDLGAALSGVRVVVSALLLDADSELGDHANGVLAALRAGDVPVDHVADGDEIVAGVRLRSAPGHRLGHSFVEFLGEGERFVFLADVVHAREHVEHPEWDFLHDSDPRVGLATRRALVAELAGTGAVVACSHVGAFGRIDAGLRWVDVD